MDTGQLKWVWQQPNWPQWRWNNFPLSAAVALAATAKDEALRRTKRLTPPLDAIVQVEFLVQEGLSTSAIEGELLDVDSLRSSIARRLGVQLEGKAAAPVPRAVEGLVDVLQDATQNYAKPLTLARLSAWQAALFPTGRSGLYEIRVGQLRGEEPMRIVSGPHQRERVHYEAPPRAELEMQLQEFIDWFNGPSLKLDGLVRAGLAHLWFEVLHPYEDGNGRVGRALLDMALTQDEQRSMRVYSISAQLYHERNEYYAALEHASRGDLDVTAWLDFFARQVEAAAKTSELSIGKVLDKARFWMANGAKPMNDRQRKVVNLLLDKGRGGFEGGMTNAKYVRIAKTSPATAQRDLAELVNSGVLTLVGAGRGARYDVQWDAQEADFSYESDSPSP